MDLRTQLSNHHNNMMANIKRTKSRRIRAWVNMDTTGIIVEAKNLQNLIQPKLDL